MSRFIVLLRYPDQVFRMEEGVRVAKDIKPHLERTKEIIRSSGASLKAFETTIGSTYDAVAIFDLLDDTMLRRVVDAIRRLSDVWVEPLRTLSPEQLDRYIAAPR